MSVFYDWLFVLVVQCLCFFVLWIWSYFYSKISWVDFFWSASIGLWAIVLSFYKKAWPETPKLLLSAIFVLWSLRLSSLLFRRLKRHSSEDRRYLEIKTAAEHLWKRKSLLIFFMNAVLASILIIPLLNVLDSDFFEWSIWVICGITLSFVSILGEGLADYQLAQHLATGRRFTLSSGLWKYSRHPNYFFEWLFWVGIAILGGGLSNGFLGLLAPIIMYIFLNYFTGVKLSEKEAALRRPDFLLYKKKTSSFFMWPPRRF